MMSTFWLSIFGDLGMIVYSIHTSYKERFSQLQASSPNVSFKVWLDSWENKMLMMTKIMIRFRIGTGGDADLLFEYRFGFLSQLGEMRGSYQLPDCNNIFCTTYHDFNSTLSVGIKYPFHLSKSTTWFTISTSNIYLICSIV